MVEAALDGLLIVDFEICEYALLSLEDLLAFLLLASLVELRQLLLADIDQSRILDEGALHGLLIVHANHVVQPAWFDKHCMAKKRAAFGAHLRMVLIEDRDLFELQVLLKDAVE